MKKLLVVAAVIALAIPAMSARAEEGSELEISGNVTVVSGWQRQTKNPGFLTAGILTDGLAAPGGFVGTDEFGFFVDQVELDLAKSFGENIRIRADLDFSPNRVTPDKGGNVEVEQAYITANIPAGNGLEFLVGRFNSGVGLDPIDRNELSTVSFSSVHRTLLPHNILGMRFGYDFSEATRLEIYIVNNLNSFNAPGTAADTDIPSFGFNLSYNWGEEGNKSWIKFNGAGGPETATKKGMSFLGDLNGNFAVSDAFWIGAEGMYRQDDTGAGDNRQYIGGQLKARYAFSDVWDGTLRYGFIWDLDGSDVAAAQIANPVLPLTTGVLTGLGASGTMHSVSIATSYQITDGAKFVVEGSIDLSRFSAGGGTGMTPGVAGMFAYSF